ILDQDALLVGARGAWIIDHRLSIGIAGHGLVTAVPNAAYDAHLIEQGEVPLRRSSMYMGYGGLLIEPVVAYRSPVHITLPVIVGAGGVTYGYSSCLPEDFDPLTHEDRYDAQAFFVVEPGIELEMNIIPLLRVGIGASYRYTTDLNLPATPKDALRGINVGITVKVGAFCAQFVVRGSLFEGQRDWINSALRTPPYALRTPQLRPTPYTLRTPNQQPRTIRPPMHLLRSLS